MEIRRWHCYLAINCALIIPLLSAKPFSLNEAIAAESKSQKTYTAASPFSPETTTRFSLNKALSSDPVHKFRNFKQGKHYSSPLTFGKLPSFKTKTLAEIASQFKRKSLSDLLQPLYKRKAQSKKREAYKNGKIDEKYFPLFRNLGLLFDNLLNDSGDSYEVSKKKHKRRKYSNDEGRGVVCSCAVKSDTEPGETKTYKKTTIPPKTISSEPSISFEKSPAAQTTTDSSMGHISSLRQNKDVSLLFPRDTSSSRRDDYGHSKRSRAAFHRSAERDLARNNGNRKHTTRNRKYAFSAEYDEEDTNSSTRDDASCDESGGGRSRGNISFERNSADEDTSFAKTKKADDDLGRHYYKLPREIKFKTRRNETESQESVPKHIRGIRGHISKNKISDIAEPLQSEEDHEKSVVGVAFDNADDKRLSDRSGTSSRENQEIRPRDETVSINDIVKLNIADYNSPKTEPSFVSIIDGYSVARDKNGQSKIAEKSIRVHR